MHIRRSTFFYAIFVIIFSLNAIITSNETADNETLAPHHGFELAPSPLYGITKTTYEKVPADTKFPPKHTTVLIYIAGCNDLLSFIERNLLQLMQVGTNSTLTILVFLNTVQQGRKKITQRFIVYKNKLVQVGDDPAMDSGHPDTLIQACVWAFTNFPATDVRMVDLWNHGTGGLEPRYRKAINPAELYRYNPTSGMIELNRSLGFLDYLQNRAPTTRGICFDDLTRNYLTNRQVGDALRKVSEICLKGEPFEIVCCDACLMGCIEVAYSLKPYGKKPVARLFVASQEVVLATGYPYTRLFSRTAQTPLDAYTLAKHIVESFGQAFHPITKDYTHSAVDLTHIDPLYDYIEQLAQLLIEGMQNQQNNSVRLLLKKCSSKELCTYFEEPTYKDLYHLCTLLIQHASSVQLKDNHASEAWTAQFKHTAQHICKIIKNIVIHNVTGPHLSKAEGISIYLPSETIHYSYATTDFGKETSWLRMLQLYIYGT